MAFLQPEYLEHFTTDAYRDLLLETDITYTKGYLGKQKENHIVDLFDTYRNSELHPELKELKLSDKDFNECQFSPKALSYRLYGTPDFDYIIMAINEIDHPGDFLQVRDKVLVVPTEDYIKNVLTQTYGLMDDQRKLFDLDSIW